MDWNTDIKIPDSERIQNKKEVQDDNDSQVLNARWIMRLVDKIIDGQYRLRIPRYNGLENFPNPAYEGEIGFDTVSKHIYYYDGTEWQPFGV